MKYELNEYYVNIPDEDLLSDLCRVAESRHQDTITVLDYRRYGKYGSNTFQRRFGSWTAALTRAGLKVHSRQMAAAAKKPGNTFSSNQQLLDDIVRVAGQLSLHTVTTGQYKEYGKFDRNTITKRFGSWDRALNEAGLSETGFSKEILDSDLLLEIQRLWITLGRQPTTTDVKKNLSKYSLNTFTRRFGGWRQALQEFVNFVEDGECSYAHDESQREEDTLSAVSEPSSQQCIVHTYNTNRTPNYRLRFKVMQRDSFRCCVCGASPAKDPAVVLHVDHITPWSKGGETVMPNLQTLCSKCNLGKSDLY